MIDIKQNGMVDARQLHSKLEIKTRFATWVERVVERCGLIEGKEFFPNLGKTSLDGGRPSKEYDFTIDSAKEACIVSESTKSSEVRKYLIYLSNQVESNDLLTHDQVIFLVKLKEVFKYISNCKEAQEMHINKFTENRTDKFRFADFHQMRNSILNLGKDEINLRLKKYCIENQITTKASTKIDKLALLDKYEILRNGIWDYLMASGSNQSMKLAELCTKMARVESGQMYRNNEDNLFQERDTKGEIKNIPSLNISN